MSVCDEFSGVFVLVLGKNTVIYDLDDTLYNKTEELGDILDTTMAEALVYDLGLKMDIDEVKKLVTQSYKIYRDGGEIFYQNYGIQPKDLFIAYHRRKPVERIVPYHNLLSKIEKVPAEQFIFTASDRYASEKILSIWVCLNFLRIDIIRLRISACIKRMKMRRFIKIFAKKLMLTLKTVFLLMTVIPTWNLQKKPV